MIPTESRGLCLILKHKRWCICENLNSSRVCNLTVLRYLIASWVAHVLLHILLLYCDWVMHVIVTTLKPNINSTKPLILWKCFNSSCRTKLPPFLARHLKRNFMNENVRIANQISLKIVTTGPIDKMPALVQVMAWRCSDDKPLSQNQCCHGDPTHKCFTRPQRF